MQTVNIQDKLDEWLAGNPEAQKYITKLYYIPAGQYPPPDVTHSLDLQSESAPERVISIGCVVVPEFALFLDMLLAMVATNPGGDIPLPPTQ